MNSINWTKMERIVAYLPINALLYERVRPETKLWGSLRCREDVQELLQPLCPFPCEPLLTGNLSR